MSGCGASLGRAGAVVAGATLDVVRHELAVLARRPTARVTAFSTRRPTDWQPGQVRNPQGSLDGYFTDSAAWELIAEKLEAGHGLEVVSLKRPLGKTAYVMIVELEEASPPLYVKLELGSGKI